MHNAKSTYTIHILKTEHDNGLMEKPKNLEKLVKRLEEELLENIYIYIYIYIKRDKLLKEHVIGEHNQILKIIINKF